MIDHAVHSPNRYESDGGHKGIPRDGRCESDGEQKGISRDGRCESDGEQKGISWDGRCEFDGAQKGISWDGRCEFDGEQKGISRDENSAAGWRASLDLHYVAQAGRTWLAQRSHRGPLVVQRPFYPEGGVCHTYIVHPPGGIVGGDCLELHARAGAEAHVLLTTPAATKFYRSCGPSANVTQQVSAEDACVEWLPQENIYYPDANVRASTQFHLNAGSRIMAWEIGCLGLPASGLQFTAGSLHLALELWIGGQPRFIDRLRVCGDDAALGAAWGLAGYTVFGTLLAYPARDEDIEAAREIELDGGEIACTLVDGVLVARCLARRAADARAAFVAMWSILRPSVLGRAPCAPRIWAT